MFRIFKTLLLIIIFIIVKKIKNYKSQLKADNINNISQNLSDFSKQVPLIGNILNRRTISLNGKWSYIIDMQEIGFYDSKWVPRIFGYFANKKPIAPEDLVEYSFDKAPVMEIPSDWNTKDEKLFFYEGTIWFRRVFNYKKINEKSVFLYFGAVNYEALVSINGNYIGRHEGGFTPFNFNITDYIKDGENFIIIKVNNQRKIDNVPTIIFDWWNYGGITRDVYLVETDNIFIQNYFFYLSKNEDEGYKIIIFDIKLNCDCSENIEIYIPELNIKKIIKTDSEGKGGGTIEVKNLILWSPENPKLYDIELKLGVNKLKDEIGFRIIEVQEKKILLNKKPIFLRGISIHEEKSNGGGKGLTPKDVKETLGWAKELGCNFVRLAHYPHNEYMIKEAEKMGFMVWSEIPVYWTINFGNDLTLENAKSQLDEMISRDKNRANIIIWSIANETPPSELRDKFLAKLAQYAHSLDNTRLISMAMQTKRIFQYDYLLEDEMNKYVDVISFNQYLGWYQKVKDFSKVNIIIPYNKPIIMSEFGGGAKYGYHGEVNQRWTEEFQENVYINNLKIIDKIDGLAGTTPWILKDFRSPRRVLAGMQDFYNMKGLVSDKGEKKKSFFVMRNWYKIKKEKWK